MPKIVVSEIGITKPTAGGQQALFRVIDWLTKSDGCGFCSRL